MQLIKIARHSLRGTLQQEMDMTKPRNTRLGRIAPANWSAAERRNWGYWDGRADAASGRTPQWNTAGLDQPHPLDADYGAAYWAGRAGAVHPNL